MNQIIHLFLFIFILGTSVDAQNIYKDAIVLDANKSATAHMVQDVSTYMGFMHPNIIEMGGGKDLMKDIISTQIGTFKQMNVEMVSINFEDPSTVVTAGEELHCTISGIIKLKLGEDDFDTPINLLAASQDSGESWKFIDLALYNAQSLKLYLPDYNDALVLPE